jgi:hypothetical protein
MRVSAKTKRWVFAAFVVIQAVTFILYALNWEPVSLLAPISVVALIAYSAFILIARR